MDTVEQKTELPAFTFVGFIHEGVPCSLKNLDACIRFYTEVLGLRLLPRPKALDDIVPGAWIGNEKVQFHLIAKEDEYRPGPEAKVAPAGRHTAWMVENLEPFRARLRALGVPFEENAALLGATQLFAQDPEGHTWEFQELRR